MDNGSKIKMPDFLVECRLQKALLVIISISNLLQCCLRSDTRKIITIWYSKIYLINFRGTFSKENTGFDENLAKLPEVVGHWFQCPTITLMATRSCVTLKPMHTSPDWNRFVQKTKKVKIVQICKSLTLLMASIHGASNMIIYRAKVITRWMLWVP